MLVSRLDRKGNRRKKPLHFEWKNQRIRVVVVEWLTVITENQKVMK